MTRGRGGYWTSNAHKASFRRRWGVGIGQVNRKDEAMRGALQAFIANYLAVPGDQVPRERGEDDKRFRVRHFR